MKPIELSDSTKAVHLGRDVKVSSGFVNLPVYHGSTVLYDSVEHLQRVASEKQKRGQITYGRRGTPASHALEHAVAQLEGAHDAIAVSSGLSAITNALLAFVKAGDHVLVVDAVYTPTRKFCDTVLAKFGVDTTYYDPLFSENIESLILPNTKVIYLESPGSNSFEIQDIPAIAEVARKHGLITILDNTWGTPINLKPFELGVDISVHAATKYITGHADAMLGIICANEKSYPLIRDSVYGMGECAGPEVIFLGLRGLRTLPARLRQHQESGLQVARWLANQRQVAQVYHPGLPHDPGYRIWSRDFRGACGLFAFTLDAPTEAAAKIFADSLTLFGKGYSWGGFESLLIPTDPNKNRTASKWEHDGFPMRIHVGLEDPKDLIADLQNGFQALQNFVDQ